MDYGGDESDEQQRPDHGDGDDVPLLQLELVRLCCGHCGRRGSCGVARGTGNGKDE